MALNPIMHCSKKDANMLGNMWVDFFFFPACLCMLCFGDWKSNVACYQRFFRGGTPEVSVGDVVFVWRVYVQVLLPCFESVFPMNPSRKNSAACYAVQLSIKGVSEEKHQSGPGKSWVGSGATQRLKRTPERRMAKNRANWLASKWRA